VGDRLSIGEMARRAGLSVSAVRFYSDRGLLPPAEVDPVTGYRSYRERQVDDAVTLRELRRLGMPLADVAVFLDSSLAERRALLDGHLAGLEQQLLDARTTADALLDRLDRTESPMTSITIDARELRAALDQVLPAAGRDPDKPALHNVLVDVRDGSLRLVATDSYRLVVRDLASSGAPYPDYEALLSMERAAREVIVPRDALLDALDAVAGEPDDAVLLSSEDDRLIVQRLDVDATVTCRYQGPPVHVALLPSFAADALRAAVGPEVVIEITDPLRPVVFRSADDGTCTTMLMPVRLA
jgi:DNA-binding transcriptional MerR regulator